MQGARDLAEARAVSAERMDVCLDGLAHVGQEQRVEVVEVQPAVHTLLLDEAMLVPAPGHAAAGIHRPLGHGHTALLQRGCGGHRLATVSPLKRSSRTRWLAALRTSPPHHGR